MIRKLTALAFAMLFSSMAWATDDQSSAASSEDDKSFAEVLEESDDSSTARRPNAYCYQYNQHGNQAQAYCQRDVSCYWDYRRGCLERNNQPQRCEYIRDYYECQQSGCYWDSRYGCSARPQQPPQCEYIRDAYQCESNGCYWDNRYGCSRYPNGGGGAGGGAIYQCTAKDRGWEEHRGGHTAQGRSQWEAQQAALAICQKPRGVHDQCVISSCQRVR